MKTTRWNILEAASPHPTFITAGHHVYQDAETAKNKLSTSGICRQLALRLVSQWGRVGGWVVVVVGEGVGG